MSYAVTGDRRCVLCSATAVQLPGSSRPEHMNGSDNILATDRTLVHPLAAFSAGDHVSTLQEDTLNRAVHADLTKVLLRVRKNRFSATF